MERVVDVPESPIMRSLICRSKGESRVVIAYNNDSHEKQLWFPKIKRNASLLQKNEEKSNLCLPFNSTHRAKTHKMTNSGVVAFDIYKPVSGKTVCIDPASMEVVYGGFTTK